MIDFNKNKGRPLDLITIGRACIDLNAVEYNLPMEKTKTFSKYVGGSPANIAIGSAKLGLKVGFIGKISDDPHGYFVSAYLKEMGINTQGIIVDKKGHKMGLTFTEIKSPKECQILMYREKVADLYLEPKEIEESYIGSSRLILISGTALAQSPSREAVLKAIELARKNDCLLAFELDFRPYTWQSPEETALYYRLVAESADIVIGTREEYNVMEECLAGSNEETVAYLFKHSPELLIIKEGVKGSFAYLKEGETFKAGIYPTKVLKTFGAGDSYASALLYSLLAGQPIQTSLKYASASASIVVSRHSSSSAMPSLEEIKNLVDLEQEVFQ